MAQPIEAADFISFDDITERFAELRDDRDSHVLGAPDGSETPNPEGWREENPDEAEELDALESLLADTVGCGGDHQFEGDWYPGQLIAESGFVEYCKEFLADIGDIPHELPSYIAIDWDRTADNLKVDYSEVELFGDSYLYR